MLLLNKSRGTAIYFNHPDDNKKLQEFRNTTFIDRNTVRFTGRVRHKNGEYRWYETVEYIRDSHGEVIQSICVGRDITERQEAEEAIAHLANHDSLTGLPNRRLFKRRVSLLLEELQSEIHGLMLLDLDGFKYVNDTFGHEIGDLLLVEVAKRLAHAVGDNGLVARWGGDEFTILYSNLKSRGDLTSIIRWIEEVISEPIDIASQTLSIRASIGFSISPEDGNTVEALFGNADAAMYRVKNQEKSW